MSLSSQCCTVQGTYFNETFLTPWTYTDIGDGVNNHMTYGTCTSNTTENGGITTNTGLLRFNQMRNGRHIGVKKTLPGAGLNNTTWSADFRLTISPTPQGGFLVTNNANLFPIYFSNTGSGLISSYADPSVSLPCSTYYPEPYGHAIGVSLTSGSPASCGNSTPNGIWTFRGFSKYFSGFTYSAPIPLTASVTYYIRIERLSATLGRISVFSDACYSIDVTSSPQTSPINSNISSLTQVQSQSSTWSSTRDIFNGSIRDLKIDNGVNPAWLYVSPDVVNCNPLFSSAPAGNSNNPGPSVQTYNWTSSNPNVTPGYYGPTGGVQGLGNSTITISATRNGCTVTDTFLYVGMIADARPDRKICSRGDDDVPPFVQIGGNSTEGKIYSWSSPGSTILCNFCPQTLARHQSTGPVTYTLIVTDPITNLSYTDQVIITHSAPVANPIALSITSSNYTVNCCAPNATAITTTRTGGIGSFSYLWNSTTSSSISNLSSVNTLTPYFAYCGYGSNPAYFYITGTDNSNQCQASATTTVNYITCPNPTCFQINNSSHQLDYELENRSAETGTNQNDHYQVNQVLIHSVEKGH